MSKPKAIKDADDRFVEYEKAYKSNLSVIHKFDDNNSLKVEQKYEGKEKSNTKILELAGQFLLLNKTFSIIYGENLKKRKLKIENIIKLAEDYYEVTFTTEVQDQNVPASYFIRAKGENIRKELLSKIDASPVPREPARMQEWTTNQQAQRAAIEALNNEVLERLSQQTLSPGVTIGSPANVIAIEVFNFEKFLDETLGTKKTKLFFFINYLLMQKMNLTTLANTTDNEMELIEELLRFQGDKLLQPFFSKKNTFDVDLPSWEGKREKTPEEVKWFPDFIEKEDREKLREKLISSPFYQYGSLKSQRLYDPFSNEGKLDREIVIFGRKSAKIEKKTYSNYKDKRDQILAETIRSDYAQNPIILGEVLNIWEGWVRANYFNKRPLDATAGGAKIEILIGLQTSYYHEKIGNRRITVLGDVKYILQGEEKINLSRIKARKKKEMKLDLIQRYKNLYPFGEDIAPTIQEETFWMERTTAFSYANALKGSYLPCIIPDENWHPTQLKGLWIRYRTWRHKNDGTTEYIWAHDFILTVRKSEKRHITLVKSKNIKGNSIKCYEYTLTLRYNKEPLYMYQQENNKGTIIISKIKYNKNTKEKFWLQWRNGDFQNLITYIKYYKGTFNPLGDLEAGRRQSIILEKALGEPHHMHMSKEGRKELMELLGKRGIKLLYKMWMHDFGIQKNMLVRTTYMLGKKAIPFTLQESEKYPFTKLYDANTPQTEETFKGLCRQIRKKVEEKQPISFFGDILTSIALEKNVGKQVVKETFTLKFNTANGIEELKHTMIEGPSVTNVTNLFRKACFWLCSLKYKFEGVEKDGLLNDDGDYAEAIRLNTSILVKKRKDEREEEGVNDNSDQKTKDLMNSSLMSLIDYLDYTCGLYNKHDDDHYQKDVMRDFTVSNDNEDRDEIRTMYNSDEIDRIFKEKAQGGDLMNGATINAEFVYRVLGMIIYHKTTADGNQVQMAKALGKIYGQSETNNGMLVNTALISFDRLAALIANWFSTFLIFQRGKSAVIGFVGNRSVCNSLWVQKVQNWCQANIQNAQTIRVDWKGKLLMPLLTCYSERKSILEEVADWFASHINDRVLTDKVNNRGKSILKMNKKAYNILKILETLKALKTTDNEKDKTKLKNEILKIDSGVVNIQSLFEVESVEDLFKLTQKVSIEGNNLQPDLAKRVSKTKAKWEMQSKNDSSAENGDSGETVEGEGQSDKTGEVPSDKTGEGQSDKTGEGQSDDLYGSDGDYTGEEEEEEEEEESDAESNAEYNAESDAESYEMSSDDSDPGFLRQGSQPVGEPAGEQDQTPEKKKRTRVEFEQETPGIGIRKMKRENFYTAKEMIKRAIAVTPSDIESEVSLIVNRNSIKSLMYFFKELAENLENEGDDLQLWYTSNQELYETLKEFLEFISNSKVEDSLDYILFMWRNFDTKEEKLKAVLAQQARDVIMLFNYLKRLAGMKLAITSSRAIQKIQEKNLAINVNTVENKGEVTMSVYCDYVKTKVTELMKDFYKFPAIVQEYIDNPVTIHILDEIKKIIGISRYFDQTSKEAQEMRGITIDGIESRRYVKGSQGLTDINIYMNQKSFSEEEKQYIRNALIRYRDHISKVLDEIFNSSVTRRSDTINIMDIIDGLLFRKNLKREKIDGDGNCLFASILKGAETFKVKDIFTKKDGETDIVKIRKTLNDKIITDIRELRRIKKDIEARYKQRGKDRPKQRIELKKELAKERKTTSDNIKNEDAEYAARVQVWEEEEVILGKYNSMNNELNSWYRKLLYSAPGLKRIFEQLVPDSPEQKVTEEDKKFEAKLLAYRAFLTKDTSLTEGDDSKKALKVYFDTTDLGGSFWGGQLEIVAARELLRERNVDLVALTLTLDNSQLASTDVRGDEPELDQKITILHSRRNHYDLLVDNDEDTSTAKNQSGEKEEETVESLQQKIDKKRAELSELENQLLELKQKKDKNDPVPMEVDPDDPAPGD